MLEGQLVRLRALEPSDAARAYNWINDREVTQYLLMRYPMSLAAEQQYLEEAAKKNSFEDTRLAIETKDGVHIGMCGLHRGRAEDRKATLGIMIGDKSYWSKGHGTDATLTLLHYAFEQLNMNRVDLHVFEFNDRAIACYRKCGFVDEGRLREEYFQDGRYWDLIAMGILRREFEALHGAATAETQATS